jgi:hypothetical protein
MYKTFSERLQILLSQKTVHELVLDGLLQNMCVWLAIKDSINRN